MTKPDRVTTDVDIATLHAIGQLTAEHAYRLDHDAADTLHELYTVDGELLGLPPRDLIGRPAITEWGKSRVKIRRTSRHVETNHRLAWVNGELHGTLYATVYRSDTTDTTATSPFMIGDYEDVYAQEGGHWRIRRRTIRRAFRVAGPPTPAAPETRSRQAKAFKLDEMALQQVRPGFARTGVRSDGSLTTINWFEPGFRSQGPHEHPFDQLSFVLTGAMRFYVGEQVIELQSPSVLHIPGGVPHGAEPIGDDRVLNVDVYAPVRADYLFLCEHQEFDR